MKPNLKRAVIVCFGVILAVVVLVALLQEPSRSQRLDDGSVLTLVEVQLGQTNNVPIGSSLERLFARWIPSNGVSVLGLRMGRPLVLTYPYPEGEALTCLFRLSNATPKKSLLLDLRYPRPQLRIVLRARTGHEYEGHLGSFDHIRSGSNYFAIASLTAFPRDEPWLEAQVVVDYSEGNREVVARLKFRNPAARTAVAWRAETVPVVRRFEGLELTIGQVTTSPRVWRTPRGPSETGSIPVRVTERGLVSTNWALHDIRVRDGLGNYWFHNAPRLASNDWRYHAIWAGLDPSRVWKVEAHLARDSGFSPEELHTVRLTMPLRGTIQTNFQGVPVSIGFVNTDMLNVEILTNRSDLRLSFVRATDQNGKDLDAWSGSWGQRSFWRSMNLPPPGEILIATFAIHRNESFECFVQPKVKDAPSTGLLPVRSRK